jgi:hypothetical protein
MHRHSRVVDDWSLHRDRAWVLWRRASWVVASSGGWNCCLLVYLWLVGLCSGAPSNVVAGVLRVTAPWFETVALWLSSSASYP